MDQAYAKGLSLWQHKVIRRYAQRQLNARTDIVALAQAKAEIRALVERDFNRKSTRSRKRHARFLEDHASATLSVATLRTACRDDTNDCETESNPPLRVEGGQWMSSETSPVPANADAFTDDEALPVFEANLDLPRVPAARVKSQRCKEAG